MPRHNLPAAPAERRLKRSDTQIPACTTGKMVGLVRFELTTSCTPCKRATRLRYSPMIHRKGEEARCPGATQALSSAKISPTSAGDYMMDPDRSRWKPLESIQLFQSRLVPHPRPLERFKMNGSRIGAQRQRWLPRPLSPMAQARLQNF